MHFDKPHEIQKFKSEYRQTLQGWIGYINDYSVINQEQVQASEQSYKEKYNSLVADWNEFVPKYEKLIDDHAAALNTIETLNSRLSLTQPSGEPIKILFFGASPIDADHLRLDEELRDIEQGLKAAKLRDQFDLKSQWAITTKILQQSMLEQHPNIVHFSGHGNSDGIAVEDVNGATKLIDNQALGNLFSLFAEKIKCVVLNSCYSEAQANEIARHVPFVIGMKSSVNDKAAIAFSVGFYAALGAGRDIEFAYKMGVVSIQLEGISDAETPVIIRARAQN